MLRVLPAPGLLSRSSRFHVHEIPDERHDRISDMQQRRCWSGSTVRLVWRAHKTQQNVSLRRESEATETNGD
jgi:hypothetical protein